MDDRLEHIIKEGLKARADEPVLWWQGGTMNGAEVLSLIEEDIARLKDAGFTEGQRIMTLLPNCPALVALAAAVWSLKGTLIPMNMRAGRDNLLPTIELLQPFAIFIGRGDAKAAEGVEGYAIAEAELDGCIDPFKGMTKQATDPDLAVFFATSGTTGLPKAVPLTHDNLISNVDSSVEAIGATKDDSVLWVLPNFHSFGFTLGMLLPLRLHSMQVIVPLFMPPLATLQAIRDGKCTLLLLVPAMMDFLKRAAAHSDVKADTVKCIITGGDRLNTKLDEAAVALFGVPIHEGYGTTECSPVVAVNRPREGRKLGTIGPVLPGYEWEVRDRETGEALPPNTPGVLFVRGRSVFHGYYMQPEATAERLSPDGWYNTGDVVEYDEDGYLTVLDRLTDIIIVGGFNVYPQEVERVLNSHPAVALSAVVSMKHKVQGEIPRAFIVVKPDMHLTEREVIDFCKDRLAGYKVPRKIDFVEELPLSPAGKVLRRELRKAKA